MIDFTAIRAGEEIVIAGTVVVGALAGGARRGAPLAVAWMKAALHRWEKPIG